MSLSEQDLQRLLEATQVMISTLQLSDLLATVMRLATDVVRAEASSLLLLDPVTGELYFDVALGEKSGAVRQIRLKKGEGIAGWVAEHNQTALVNDVKNDPRWAGRTDDKTQFKTQAILAVPMRVREKLIGVMEVINRGDGAPFTELDGQILQAFAAQAGAAIENARLFESIRQEKEKMSTVLREMGEGAVLLDPAGRVLLANPSAGDLLGRTHLQGLDWAELEAVFTFKPAWGEMKHKFETGGSLDMTRQAPPPFTLAGVLSPIFDDTGQATGHLLILRDVTEERREAVLKKNFLSLVSHKLKTPLVAIRGFTPMLLEKPEELTSFQKTGLETIDRNSQLLASLVDKLMWFAALESDDLAIDRKPQLLLSILDLALSDLAGLLKNLDAVVQRDPNVASLPLVKVDKMWMKEALRNLIENAVKFNSQGKRQVDIAGRLTPDQRVEITIRDNGPGIPPEEQSKIFQKFYQIESSFTGQVQGMGLGLALVKRVIEAHGGSVRVESQLGKGSAFTISLPGA